MRRLTKNKKGDVSDVMVFLLVGVFLAISFIVVLFVNSKLSEVIETTALNESDASADILSAFDTINTKTVQRGYAMFMGIFIIGIMVSAFLVRIHPAFIFLYIIVLAFTVFVAVFLGNLYDTVTDVDDFVSIAGQQGMINYFMENIVIIVLAVGALSMIVVFAKIFGSPGGSFGGDI